MERIEQALQKAREQRQGNAGQSTSDVTPTDSNLGRSNVGQSYADLPEVIAYEKTRRIHLDVKKLTENRVVTAMPDDPRVEPYRQLRTQIIKIMNDNQWNTLAITSANEKAGKTLTAVNLAIAISREVNHTVLLVDLDLRNPSVAKTLGMPVDSGLVDLLNGDVELECLLVNPGYPRLVVIPGRAKDNCSSELLSSPKMKRLVTDVRNRYQSRIIIFDLPPLLRNDDALVFTPTVDATLLVVEDGVTTEKELHRCLQFLEGSNLIGTILNKAK